MKQHRIIILIAAIACLITGVSCKKYLTVEPQASVVDKQFFTNEMSYKEALNGVYIKMTEPAMYGRELTFGLADALGGMYNGPRLGTAYRDAFAGNYQNAAIQTMINGVWGASYNTLANANRLIEALETADTTIFLPLNYKIIMGEALALRALVHFDMLRLYGKSYAAGGKDFVTMPYITKYGTKNFPRISGGEVISKVNADIDAALSFMSQDPILTRVESLGDNAYLSIANRKLRMNYYAVKALQARVALWSEDFPKALSASQEVIAVGDSYFPWIANANIATADPGLRDRIFSTENIFSLYVNSMAINYATFLDTSRFANYNEVTLATLNTQFENSATDYRRVYLVRDLALGGTTGTIYFFGKLYQSSNIPAAYSRRMPMFRISEMYYIAAECLKDANGAQAVAYLNKVRANRGLTALATNLSSTAIQDEIRKEYWKEFTVEGQMFFYYKRKNATVVPGSLPANAYPPARYTLPLPPNELEFGE